MGKTDNTKDKIKIKRTALDEGVRYLENRMHTVYEVRKHLREKGYEEDETESAIQEMLKLKYIDDSEYARMYFEYAYDKHKGKLRILKELEERGIDKQTAEFAYEDYMYENGVDEYRAALDIAVREAEGKEINDKLVAKIARKLENKGYKGEDIIRVLNEVRRWKTSKIYTDEQ